MILHLWPSNPNQKRNITWITIKIQVHNKISKYWTTLPWIDPWVVRRRPVIQFETNLQLYTEYTPSVSSSSVSCFKVNCAFCEDGEIVESLRLSGILWRILDQKNKLRMLFSLKIGFFDHKMLSVFTIEVHIIAIQMLITYWYIRSYIITLNSDYKYLPFASSQPATKRNPQYL